MKEKIIQFLEEKNYHSSITNQKYITKIFPEICNYIIHKNNLNYSGQLYSFINNIKYPICQHCGKPYKFISFKKGFQTICPKKCSKYLIEYKNEFLKTKNNEIAACNEHNRIISTKIFNLLKQHKVEYLCEICSSEIIFLRKYDSRIAKKSKTELSFIFKTRKKFDKSYIKRYYPHFYLMIESQKNIHPNYFKNKLNQALNLWDLECNNENCSNKVSFDKKNIPKELCEKCNRIHGTKIGRSNFSNNYWADYLKSYFNKKDIKSSNIKIYNKDIQIFEYCDHHKYLNISKSKIKLYKNRGIYDLCTKCNLDFYINKNIDKNLLKREWNHIKGFPEEKLLTYNPYLWGLLKNYMKDNDVSFQEAKFRLKYNIEKNPICACLDCSEKVSFSNDMYGYLSHCDEHKFNFKTSGKEIEFKNFLEEYDIKFIHNDRNLLIGKEIDFYIPDKNLAIEFNGLYWHSEKFKDKYYHYNKWKECLNKGIKLFTIWEDDWNHQKKLLKKMVLNQLGLNQNKIYARKCEIKLLDNKDKKTFLNENHIQGNINASFNFGLFYKEELVSLMTFGKKRMIMKSLSKIDDEYELLRFCNESGTSVVGGASKLFSYFNKRYNPSSIISYANCDISNGNLYEVLGFKNIGHTGLNYWWSKNGVKHHRSNFMKYKLVKEGADPLKTGDEIMREKGYNKIWGTGNIKFEFLSI